MIDVRQLAEAARPILKARCPPNSCILSSRVVHTVALYHGIATTIVPVKLSLYEAGAFVQPAAAAVHDNLWIGHLVTVVDGMLVDLQAGQFGVGLDTVVAAWHDSATVQTPDGRTLVYAPDPQNGGYRRAQELETHGPFIPPAGRRGDSPHSNVMNSKEVLSFNKASTKRAGQQASRKKRLRELAERLRQKLLSKPKT